MGSIVSLQSHCAQVSVPPTGGPGTGVAVGTAVGAAVGAAVAAAVGFSGGALVGSADEQLLSTTPPDRIADSSRNLRRLIH
jgi:hypothetical protein